MRLTITDDERFYYNNQQHHCILLADNHIKLSNQLTADQVDALNLSLSGIEMVAADKILIDFNRDIVNLLHQKEKRKCFLYTEETIK